MLKELNETNFYEYIKKGVNLVEFYTTWCGYCQKQKPILEEFAGDKILVGTVDADKNPALARRYDIKSFPSFLLFKDGIMKERLPGLKDKYELMNAVIKHLSK